MEKKIILITGATDGIGKITATELAKKGYHVIVHGRNLAKAKTVVSEMKKETNNKNIEYLIADLFSPKSIKNMVNVFNKKYDHLDVLINNAGAVLDSDRKENEDGVELTMALNVIAPFLLNQLLLPSLKKSSDGRIIDMSSATHRNAKPDMNDLNLKNISSGQTRYGISKLFVIWNSQHLGNELKKEGITNVTVNTSHPGAVATNFGQDSDNGFLINLVYKGALLVSTIPILGNFGEPAKGAITNVYLASSEEVRGVTGKFFGNKKNYEEAATKQYTAEKEQQLWNYCMELVKPYLD